MNFTQQYGKNRQRCQQNKFYCAVWQLLLYFYREFPSKILSVCVNQKSLNETTSYEKKWRHIERELNIAVIIFSWSIYVESKSADEYISVIHWKFQLINDQLRWIQWSMARILLSDIGIQPEISLLVKLNYSRQSYIIEAIISWEIKPINTRRGLK